MSIYCDRALMILNLYYGLCTTPEMLYNEMKELKVAEHLWPSFLANDRCGATTHFLTVDGDKRIAFVCIHHREDMTGIQTAALLVHEAVHIWQEHCSMIGEWEPAKEQEAYAIQLLSQNLMELYEQQVFKRETDSGYSKDD